MIRLIASDLDGTLVPEGGSVLTPEYYDVIRELKKKGIIFIAASGRGLPSARKLLQPVSEDVYFLTEEGAYGSWRDKILFETTLDEKVAERVIRYTRDHWKDILILRSTAEKLLVEADDPSVIPGILGGYGMEWESVRNLETIHVPSMKIAVHWDREDAAKEAAALQRVAGEHASVVVSGVHWADIVPPTVSKGGGLRKFQQLLGISKEETMVFGDNLNDISMFREAAVSYAVPEARPEVKDAAVKITESRTKDGVLKIMKTLL